MACGDFKTDFLRVKDLKDDKDCFIKTTKKGKTECKQDGQTKQPKGATASLICKLNEVSKHESSFTGQENIYIYIYIYN